MTNERRLFARALKLPLLALAMTAVVATLVIASLAVAGASTVAATAALLVFVVVAVGAVVLFAIWVLANRTVSYLAGETALQVGGLVPLLEIASAGTLAPLGGSALSPAAAGRLTSLVAQERPRSIVELGSGSSTVLLARLVAALGLQGQRLVSVEHDAAFIESVEQQLDALGDWRDGRVTVVHAPLVAQDGRTWYDRHGLDSAMPARIDLLIVDGPPDVLGVGIRSPALPALQDRLAPRSIVFVDDVNRRTEHEMVEGWLSEHANLKVVLRGRDHVVLRWEDASP